MIRHTKALIAASSLGVFAVIAHAQATPVGLWKTVDDKTNREKSLVRITANGGVYAGRIEKLLDPAKAGGVCDKCSDERKDKPIVGMTIIEGLRQSDGDKAMWDGGDILDPKSGKTYKVRMTPGEGGKTLAVRGYIGTPMLGRTQTWIRVE